VSDRSVAGRPARFGAVAGRPARLGSLAALVVWAGVLARILVENDDAGLVPWYVTGLVAFLVVHLLVLHRRWPSASLLHVAFALQAGLVLVLLALNPDNDILSGLLALECYQAAVVFSGRARLAWIAALVALIPVSLVLGTGWLTGLSEAFVPMAAGVVLAMFAVVGRELVVAEEASDAMVADLREAQRLLEDYAGQAEELAAIDERSRVARELQGSVSATVAEVLAATRAGRAAGAASGEAAAQLERVQALARDALAQMRAVIAELRPPAGPSAEAAPTSSLDRT